jgi:hypothetical protein
MVDDCGGVVDFFNPWVDATRVASATELGAVSPDVLMITGEHLVKLLLLTVTEDIEVGV